MNETCSVVTVKGQDGNALRITKSDYDADPSLWELYSDAEGQAPSEPAPTNLTPAPATIPTPTGIVVSRVGKGDAAKFFAVSGATKEKVVHPGLDSENGYAT